MIDVSGFSPKELLTLHATVAEELRARGITRSLNNSTGDLAEYLFCKAFGWLQAGSSNPNIDAIAPGGMRYQIKGRRMTQHNKSRQLSGIRDFQHSTSTIWLEPSSRKHTRYPAPRLSVCRGESPRYVRLTHQQP